MSQTQERYRTLSQFVADHRAGLGEIFRSERFKTFLRQSEPIYIFDDPQMHAQAMLEVLDQLQKSYSHLLPRSSERARRAIRAIFNISDNLVELLCRHTDIHLGDHLPSKMSQVTLAYDLCLGCTRISQEFFGEMSKETILRHTRMKEVLSTLASAARLRVRHHDEEARSKRAVRKNAPDTYPAFRRACDKAIQTVLTKLRNDYALPLKKDCTIGPIKVTKRIGEESKDTFQDYVQVQITIELTACQGGLVSEACTNPLDAKQLAELLAKAYWRGHSFYIANVPKPCSPMHVSTNWWQDEVEAPRAYLEIKAGRMYLEKDGSEHYLRTNYLRDDDPASDPAISKEYD